MWFGCCVCGATVARGHPQLQNSLFGFFLEKLIKAGYFLVKLIDAINLCVSQLKHFMNRGCVEREQRQDQFVLCYYLHTPHTSERALLLFSLSSNLPFVQKRFNTHAVRGRSKEKDFNCDNWHKRRRPAFPCFGYAHAFQSHSLKKQCILTKRGLCLTKAFFPLHSHCS